jgi:hypothetical protein
MRIIPWSAWSVLLIEEGGAEYTKGRQRLMKKLEEAAASAAAESLERHIQRNPAPRFYRLAGVGDIMPGRGLTT